MSQDMLGPVVRALTAVPQERLGLIKDFAHKLSCNNGEEWEKNGVLFLRGQPNWLEKQATAEPKIQVIEPKVELVKLPEVTSDGRTGEKWIGDLGKAKYDLGNIAKYLVKSKDFVVTSGVVYRPVLIKGECFLDDDRVTSVIRKAAEDLKLLTPPAELAPLLREKVSDADLAKLGLLWVVVMHEPIEDSDRNPRLLGLIRNDPGRRLFAFNGRPDNRWNRENGFVFLAPQDLYLALVA